MKSRALAGSPWLAPVVGLLLLGLVDDGRAQNAKLVGGVYTCTDSSGRKLRSDRPIPECSDREQRVLNPSGTERARIGPTLTAQQLAEQRDKDRALAAAQAQALEERRRDRALLIRYPSREAHDKERALALAQVASVVKTASNRIDDLMLERQKSDLEMEFYKADPAKAPATLRRQIEFVTQGIESQQRFIQLQQAESARLDARFDEELARLQELWKNQASGAQAKGVKP